MSRILAKDDPELYAAAERKTFQTEPTTRKLEYDVAVAEAQLDKLKATMEASVEEHRAQVEALRAEETRVALREKALEMEHTALEEQLQRAEQQQKILQKRNEQKVVDLVRKQNRICELVDNIAGAVALSKVLEQRVQEYKVFGDFAREVHRQLMTQQRINKDTHEQKQEVFTEADRHVGEQQELLKVTEYFEKTYGRMTREHQQAQAKMQEVQREIEKMQQKINVLNQGKNAGVKQLETQITSIATEISRNQDVIFKQKQAQQTAEEQLASQMTRLSNVYTALQNMLKKVERFQDSRHVAAAQSASYDQMLGNYEYLNQLCGAFPDLSRADAAKKIIGDDLDKRLRQIHLIGLALQDIVWLEEMCKARVRQQSILQGGSPQ